MTEIPKGYKNTVIGIRPDDWKEFPLQSVLMTSSNPAQMDDSANYKLVTVKRNFGGVVERGAFLGKNILVKTQYYIATNDFLISKRQVSHGACGIVPQELDSSIVSNEYNIFRANEKLMNIHFFQNYVQLPHFKKKFYDYSDGIHIEKLLFKTKSWLRLQIPFPSLTEQEKIVEIIQTWDEAIEKQEALIEQKVLYKKGVMQKLLSGEVRFDGFTDKWQETKLGDIGSPFSGLSGKTKDDFGHGNAKYITYKSIFDSSKIDQNRLEVVDISENEHQAEVKYGDMFFTTSSEIPEEVGMSSVLLFDVTNTYLNSFCFGYRLNDTNILLPEFARFSFRGFTFRDKMRRLAQGSTRFNISKNEVMKLKILLPSISEQQKIADILAQCENEIETLKNELIILLEQKIALVQKLLTGQVRVKT